MFSKGNEKKDEQNTNASSATEQNNEEIGAKSCNENIGDTAETDLVKTMLDEKTKQCEEYFGMLQRTAAEFDNFKKRTAKEKEALYSDAVSDTISAILPVVDNFERAMKASESEETTSASFKEGIDLVYRQLKDVLKNLGVEEIKCVGEEFDPQLHNAVMHIEDDSFGDNTVVDEFQKGYILKDKVIRHSMVKVAN
ncbi:MAG: nucleotide exchange factor GrpE [Bacillota bacterium]|nr:nucleotide exchange factor GrpE [Bacillota bacterium]